jgi:ADP-ribosylglycohydrolase
LQAGETTDDTAHTVLVVQMLAETGGNIDPADYVRRLKAWLQRTAKSAAVTGPSTARAIALIEQGTPIEEAGRTGFTNGGAMKIAPVGLTGSPDDLPTLVERVHYLCMPTHNTMTAVSGASAIAAVFACTVAGVTAWEQLWMIAKDAARLGAERGHYFAAASMEARLDLARRTVEGADSHEEALDAIYGLIGTGLPMTETVPAAMAIAYLADGDPVTCARYSANLGGDTDTIGAISCGICGALSGDNAFSCRDVSTLQKVNGLDFTALAQSLISL